MLRIHPALPQPLDLLVGFSTYSCPDYRPMKTPCYVASVSKTSLSRQIVTKG